MTTADEFADLLADADDWALRRHHVDFGPNVPTASPADTTWLYWWAPILGPGPPLVLSYLHHLAIAGRDRVDLRTMARAIGADPTGEWGPGHQVVTAITAIASHRLAMATTTGDLVLVDPIYRPGSRPAREVLDQLTTTERTS